MATVTLSPDGVGDETAIPILVGADTHWQAVLTNDGDTSYVAHPGGEDTNWYSDLYTVGNSSVSGVISEVRVWVYEKFPLSKDGYTSGCLKFLVKTHETVYEESSLVDSYNYHLRASSIWTTNPYTGNAWTWNEVNALQVGMSLSRTHSFVPGGRPQVRVTQVYVVVTYTPAPPPVTPTVTTDPATALLAIAATPNGTLDDDGGEACECGFEWGLDTGYGTTTPPQSKTTGETFSQVIGGLFPNTTYHFRAFATNSVGTDHGDDRTFTTALVISRAFALAREEL